MNLGKFLKILERLDADVLDDFANRIARAEANDVNLTLLQSAADLPTSAGPRQWFRVQGDTNIYVGNGQGNALRKIPTVP